MNQSGYDKIVEELSDIDLGISESDSALTKIGKRVIKGVVKNILKDRSGSTLYKTVNLALKLIGEKEACQDFLEWADTPSFCHTPQALHQYLNCLETVLLKQPELSDDVISHLIRSTHQKENNPTTVADTFRIAGEINKLRPELAADMQACKKNALVNLCTRHPEQGMMFISSQIKDTYPNKDNLNVIYQGINAMLANSELSKSSYKPLLMLLNECSKNGYNTGENKKLLNAICADIEKRNPQSREQIIEIRRNVNALNNQQMLFPGQGIQKE